MVRAFVPSENPFSYSGEYVGSSQGKNKSSAKSDSTACKLTLDSIPSKLPTFGDETAFLEYNQPHRSTDHTSKGEAYAKFLNAVKTIYSIPSELITNQNVINQTVLNNATPYNDATRRHNLDSFYTGQSSQTSSSPYPSYDSYNSKWTTVEPIQQNPIGSRFSFIRPKQKVPAYINDGTINIYAMKNTFRPTNGKYFTDTPQPERIPDGLYASSMTHGLSMPRHPNYPDKDISISVFHHNANAITGQYPSTEFVHVIRKILPKVNEQGFTTHDEARDTRTRIASGATNPSTQILVEDFVIVKLNNDRFYIVPSFN